MLRVLATTAAVVALANAEAAEKDTFVRWGSRSCPAGTTLLYEGIASGAHYNHWGSGANVLCLHANPEYAPGSSTSNRDGGLLYGTEYENTGRMDMHHNQDAACAMCQVDTPGSVYVQWGRSHSCSNGHDTLYHGLVMANYYHQRRSEFVCVDLERARHQQSSGGNSNGNLWYTTETEGGSIDETLYPQDVEVGCSVCLSPRETYVRWGAKTCTKGSKLVFDGIAGGAHYSHSGSGHNALCLHKQPQYPLGGIRSGNNNGALIYGVEYQNSGVMDKNHDKDAACAVCMPDTDGDVYVQWGRSKGCSNSHTTLYSGFVMAERYNHRKSEFVCVDPLREFHARNSNGDQNGLLWYTTEVESGSMDETMYKSNVELGCSVCLAPKTTFVTWGKKTCPTKNADLVYTGIAASGHYGHRGSGANTLCLHSKPENPDGHKTSNQDGGARIYGTEYQNTGTIDKNHDKDAACAVCQLKSVGNVYVQWGRSQSCSNNHEKLYSGYVMSNHYSQNKNEFVCVHPDREFHARSSNSDNNGNLWYTVEVEGGSMDEQTYPHNREIGCSVCVTDKTDIAPTPPPTLSFDKQKAFTDLAQKVDALEKSVAKNEADIRTVNNEAAKANAAFNTELLLVNTNIETNTNSTKNLDTKLSNAMSKLENDLRSDIEGAFTTSATLELPQVQGADLSKLCNGDQDAEVCADLACSDANAKASCPVKCNSCVEKALTPAIQTLNKKVTIAVNKGERVVVNNGFSDEILTATEVKNLVADAVSQAFSNAASEMK